MKTLQEGYSSVFYLFPIFCTRTSLFKRGEEEGDASSFRSSKSGAIWLRAHEGETQEMNKIVGSLRSH